MTPPRLALSGIVKRYGEILALDGVGLDVAPGEVHAVVGENGAGKSTLMKILSGAVRRDRGSMEIDGRVVAFGSPADAIEAGVGMIAQELQLVPSMTVAENIVLGAEPTHGRTTFIDRRRMADVAARALTQLGEPFALHASVDRLSVAERQIVEIARAISRKVRILALDEPTASLTPREVAGLFRVIRRLKDEGVGMLYVSHRLEEIEEIADTITVLRDGAVVATHPAASLKREEMIRLMVGRELERRAKAAPERSGRELLRLEAVTGGKVRATHLTVGSGEIFGLAGLVGAGRTELARLIFGADPRSGGRMFLEGREVAPESPRDAIELGIGLLTEDRDALGLVRSMNVRENITLSDLARLSWGPFVRSRLERDVARKPVDRLRVKPPSLEASVSELSGGNRQKVVLARWLVTRSRLLIFDEPTAGVDVGARAEIHALIDDLAAEGRGVIVISSDLDELLSVCDRIGVMRGGRIEGILPGASATRAGIMALATAAA